MASIGPPSAPSPSPSSSLEGRGLSTVLTLPTAVSRSSSGSAVSSLASRKSSPCQARTSPRKRTFAGWSLQSAVRLVTRTGSRPSPLSRPRLRERGSSARTPPSASKRLVSWT